MKWYEAGMGIVDLAFLFSIQFWTGFAVGSLLDRAVPPPERKADIQEGMLMLEVLLQVILLGYMLALLTPAFSHLSNPMWRLTGLKGYNPSLPIQVTEGHILMLGLTFGSTNVLVKLQLATRPDLA